MMAIEKWKLSYFRSLQALSKVAFGEEAHLWTYSKTPPVIFLPFSGVKLKASDWHAQSRLYCNKTAFHGMLAANEDWKPAISLQLLPFAYEI